METNELHISFFEINNRSKESVVKRILHLFVCIGPWTLKSSDKLSHFSGILPQASRLALVTLLFHG